MTLRFETYENKVILIHAKDIYKPLVELVSSYRLEGFVLDSKPSTSKSSKTDAIFNLTVADIELISRNLLCFLTPTRILKAWAGVRASMSKRNAFLADISGIMVPECVYRGGMCPFKQAECKHYQYGAIEEELKQYLSRFEYDKRVINI